LRAFKPLAAELQALASLWLKQSNRSAQFGVFMFVSRVQLTETAAVAVVATFVLLL
jgi:hypothetical protein